jgi:superkiller protein 3
MKQHNFTLTIILTFILSFAAFGQQTVEQISPSLKNPKAAELVKRALDEEKANMPEKAIETFKEILKLEPKDFAAMNSIAGNYGRLGNAMQQNFWAKMSIDTNPKFMKAYINYGNSFLMQRKFNEAIASYEKAAELEPKNHLPVYNLGVVYEIQGRIKEAHVYYKKTVELAPNFENGLFNLAATSANLKQFDEAKVLLKKVLELNPKAEDARQMLKAVEEDIAKTKKP